MSTAQMIYPDKKIALMILGKMKKLHPAVEWGIKDLPHGFKVADMNYVSKDDAAAQAGAAKVAVKTTEELVAKSNSAKSTQPNMQQAPKTPVAGGFGPLGNSNASTKPAKVAGL